MSTDTVSGGSAAGDIVSNVENLIGSSVDGSPPYSAEGRNILTDYFGGYMDGGEGDDEYHVDGTAIYSTTIFDSGSSGYDNVFLPWSNSEGVKGKQFGSSMLVMTNADYNAGSNAGIMVLNWYAYSGSTINRSIDLFVTTDHVGYAPRDPKEPFFNAFRLD